MNILTLHGAESKSAFSVIISRGTAPLHAVTPAVRCAVGVVPSVVGEGELAESSVGVSSSSRHEH